MSLKQRTLMFAIAVTAATTAAAEEIYKNVNEKGTVEFSDRPSSGAETVNVNPNVVDVEPVKPIKPSPPATTGAAAKPAPSELPEPVPVVEDSGYYGDANNRRQKREVIKQRIEQGGKPTTLPANARPGNAATRGGGHRR